MLVGYSSSRNDSDPLSHPFPPTSSTFLNLNCFISPPSNFLFAGFLITNSIVLLLLCALILYHGVCEWKQKGSSLVSTMSHSDFFTYHLVIMDLIGASGCMVCFWGIYFNQSKVIIGGNFLWFYFWFGETLFHIVTCLERYLAVAHPITYMRLRKERGLRARNISTGCVWLLSILGIGLMWDNIFIIYNFCLLTVITSIVAFCSLSALLLLTRPGKKQRVRVDQSKRRAFYTIVAILGVLVLRFIASLVWTAAYLLTLSYGCVIMGSVVWFAMPSSLILPLLFFHRANKLFCCKIGL